MSAMFLSLGGFICLNFVFFADFWKHKSLLITGCTAVYAFFAIPAYWLTALTISNFNSLYAISVIFNIMKTVFLFMISVYIPHCMRTAGQTGSNTASLKEDTSLSVSSAASTTEERRTYGLAMSAWGYVFDSGSSGLALVIVTILSNKASTSSAQNVGNLLTTIAGFLVLVGCFGCYLGLPRLPTRKWSGSISELSLPVRALLTRKNALFLLLAYAIYTDVVFPLYSNIFQVYYTQVTPGAVEASLFSLASTLLSTSFYVAYFFIQRKFRFNLEKCLLFGYALTLVVVVWGLIGMSNQDNFGEKHDWEFWIVLVIYQLGGAITNSTWRVLYSELIPAGEEFLWYGMQGVLYCATAWIQSVATTPLQIRTNNVRIPLVLCLIFGLIPVAMEAVRIILPSFKRDLLKWQNNDDQDVSRIMSMEYDVQSEKDAKSSVEKVV